MTLGKRGLAARSLEALFRSGTACGLDDSQLLERFLDRGPGTEDAFEALILRHGPMVFDVCRNILGRSHDAEDAFQATFLILATRAASVRRKSSVASWLYGVALRTASRLKQDTARRRLKEQTAAESRSEEAKLSKEPRDFRLLHEEVGRLPSKYRDPIILCYFEGMTQEMAATQLGCPAATVGVRLMRAKARLRDRLERRGDVFTPAIPLIAVSGNLIRSTVRSTIQFTEAGPVSLAVAQLTREVSKAMLMMKLKAAAAVLLVAGTVASGAGFVTHLALAEDPQPKPAASEIEEKSKPTKPKSDLEELQGTWLTQVLPNVGYSSAPSTPVELVNEKWVISGDTIRTFPGPNEQQADSLQESTYHMKIDPSKSPKVIDLIVPGVGTLPGIYGLDGDTLRINYVYYDHERPSSFVQSLKAPSTLLTFKRLRRTPEEFTPRFAIDPGCYWVTYPSQAGSMHGNCSCALMTEFESNHMTVHVACPATDPDEGPIYRPVAFDADRKRYYPSGAGAAAGGWNEDKRGFHLHRYRLDKNTLQGKKITHVGVELVTPEALERERKEGFNPAATNPKP